MGKDISKLRTAWGYLNFSDESKIIIGYGERVPIWRTNTQGGESYLLRKRTHKRCLSYDMEVHLLGRCGDYDACRLKQIQQSIKKFQRTTCGPFLQDISFKMGTLFMTTTPPSIAKDQHKNIWQGIVSNVYAGLLSQQT